MEGNVRPPAALLDYNEAGAYLRIGRTKLKELVAKQEIRAKKIGSLTRFERTELDRYISGLPAVASSP